MHAYSEMEEFMKKTNNKNRFLTTWLLSLTLVFTLMLSGCQNKEVAEDTTAATAESTVVEATTEEAVVEEVVTEEAVTEEAVADEPATTEATAEDATEATQEEITFTVSVVYEDATTEDFAITTTATTLRAALEAEGLIAGTESEYGLYVQTVNNITADESLQQWWCLTKGGEMWNNGVDTTEISDGEQYELTLTTGW
jgi:hypothetical protein